MTELFEKEIVDALAIRLSKWKSDEELKKLYLVWPSDEQLEILMKIVGSKSDWVNELRNSDSKPFFKTLCLRNEIKNVTFDISLSKWIIEDWGGIPKGRTDDSLEKCVKSADDCAKKHHEKKYSAKSKFDFERIASWSKHISFKYPANYAIYDSRVIYSLNWLLLQEKSNKYFPFPSGRNPIMELLDYSILLFINHYKERKVDVEKRLENGNEPRVAYNLRSEFFIKKGYAFSEYCDLLKKIKEILYPGDDAGLTKVEMILFSLADNYIAKDVFRYVSGRLSQGDGSVHA